MLKHGLILSLLIVLSLLPRAHSQDTLPSDKAFGEAINEGLQVVKRSQSASGLDPFLAAQTERVTKLDLDQINLPSDELLKDFRVLARTENYISYLRPKSREGSEFIGRRYSFATLKSQFAQILEGSWPKSTFDIHDLAFLLSLEQGDALFEAVLKEKVMPVYGDFVRISGVSLNTADTRSAYLYLQYFFNKEVIRSAIYSEYLLYVDGETQSLLNLIALGLKKRQLDMFYDSLEEAYRKFSLSDFLLTKADVELIQSENFSEVTNYADESVLLSFINRLPLFQALSLMSEHFGELEVTTYQKMLMERVFRNYHCQFVTKGGLAKGCWSDIKSADKKSILWASSAGLFTLYIVLHITISQGDLSFNELGVNAAAAAGALISLFMYNHSGKGLENYREELKNVDGNLLDLLQDSSVDDIDLANYLLNKKADHACRLALGTLSDN